jgi:hypothetical protein
MMFDSKEDYTLIREGIPKSKLESLKETASRLHRIPAEDITPRDETILQEIGGIATELDKGFEETLEFQDRQDPVIPNYPKPEEIPPYKQPDILSSRENQRFWFAGKASRKS